MVNVSVGADLGGSNVSPGTLNPVVAEAEQNYKRVLTWEGDARTRFLDDYKFVNADTYNGFQWPNNIRRNRDIDERPCLTINKTRQHCLQIINDAKRNKPGIIVRATGGGATFASAQVLSALVKHIEYTSKASTAYDTACEFQVFAGLGIIRVSTDYTDEETFNQRIIIERVKDPLSVYMDPDAMEKDKSDMRWCVILDILSKDAFKKAHPKWAEKATAMPLGGEAAFLTTDHICVAEYFRVVEDEDTLYALVTPNGPAYMRKKALQAAGMDADYFKGLKDDPAVRSRPVQVKKIEWYYIVGQEVVEKKDWPGKYIPIVPVIGEETIIEGQMDRKGHVRSLIDPQRMYNYWSSSAVEYGALQGKQPWLAAVEAIEGYETYYNTANLVNHAWMPYKSKTQDGKDIPPPQRIPPPVAAPVAITGMQIAAAEFGMASGQQEGEMGMQGNERSAKAINERKTQSDNATFHYSDNQAVAIRQVGVIVLDLIPKIMDVKQTLQIMAMDDQPMELILDPQAQQVYEQKKDAEGKVVAHILNPAVGRYEVQADVGPAFATQRAEAFEAFKLILTQNPTLTAFLGDILFRAGDFPHADEAAQRLRRLVPAYALGEGPTPNEQALQQQLAELTKLLTENMEELSAAKLRLKGKEQQRDIDVYGAITTRLKVLLDSKIRAASEATKAAAATAGTPGTETAPATPGVSTGEIAAIMADLMPDLMNIDLQPIINANAQSEASGQGGPGPMEEPISPGQPNDPPGVRRDYQGRPFGRTYETSKVFRPL